MSKVEFNLSGNITSILCSENDLMEEICKKFAAKTQTNLDNLIFLYAGNKINLKLTLFQIMNHIDKQRKTISILVNEINTSYRSSNVNSSLIKSNIPICPQCLETIMFCVSNYNITLSNCKNNHQKGLFIKEYEKTQIIDLNKIICSQCGTTKKKTYNNKMYICHTCKKIFCPLCRNNHDKKHAIVNYDIRNFICERHCESYNSYCNYCRVNLCLRCQKYHQDNNIISFGSIFPEKNELLKVLSNVRTIIDTFKKDIKLIINKLNIVKENIEILFRIYYEMINAFDDKKRNYEYFQSLNNIKTDMVFQNIQLVNQINDQNQKIQQILNIYENMNQNNFILNPQPQIQGQMMQQNIMMGQTVSVPAMTQQQNQMGAQIMDQNNNMNHNNLNQNFFPSCKQPQEINQYSQFGTANVAINQMGLNPSPQSGIAFAVPSNNFL